jgi:D-xylose transport system permease protein
VPGVLLGALVIATLQNGMTLMSVSPEMKLVARGLVLGLAVWADVRLGSVR